VAVSIEVWMIIRLSYQSPCGDDYSIKILKIIAADGCEILHQLIDVDRWYIPLFIFIYRVSTCFNHPRPPRPPRAPRPSLEVSLPACRLRHASEQGTWMIKDGEGLGENEQLMMMTCPRSAQDLPIAT